jgi:hypothetical protein
MPRNSKKAIKAKEKEKKENATKCDMGTVKLKCHAQ